MAVLANFEIIIPDSNARPREWRVGGKAMDPPPIIRATVTDDTASIVCHVYT